ncbi:MAG: VOC family protein [Phycisphaerales bacterium]|nr:VOC family protein [Phycisphaerales bacterium]
MAAKFEEVNPVLPVRDVRKSVRFYVDKLGFAGLFQDSEDDPHYVGVKRDAVELHLQWHDSEEWSRVERPMLRLRIEDVDRLFDEYKDKGVFHEHTQLRDTPWGTREFAFFDPDMNGLTFYRDNPSS